MTAQTLGLAQAAYGEPGGPGVVQRPGHGHVAMAVCVRLDHGAYRPAHLLAHVGKVFPQGIQVDLGPAMLFKTVCVHPYHLAVGARLRTFWPQPIVTDYYTITPLL